MQGPCKVLKLLGGRVPRREDIDRNDNPCVGLWSNRIHACSRSIQWEAPRRSRVPKEPKDFILHLGRQSWLRERGDPYEDLGCP